MDGIRFDSNAVDDQGDYLKKFHKGLFKSMELFFGTIRARQRKGVSFKEALQRGAPAEASNEKREMNVVEEKEELKEVRNS